MTKNLKIFWEVNKALYLPPSAQVAASHTHSKDDTPKSYGDLTPQLMTDRSQSAEGRSVERDRTDGDPAAVQHAVPCIYIGIRNRGNQLTRTKSETHVLPSF